MDIEQRETYRTDSYISQLTISCRPKVTMADGPAEATNINIVELEKSLRLEISPEKRFSANKSCIFKTPNILFRHNRNAYVPDAFSIGPMHHLKPHLRATHSIKSLYLHDFLSRGNISLTAVIEAVKAKEPEARACYAESVDYTPHQLVKILVVDGCFLVELFYRNSQPPKHLDDPIRTMACMYQYLCHDLILLENQIPWLVLKAVFALLDPGPGLPTLESLVINYFSCHFSTKNKLKEPSSVGYECKHVLDLIRESLIAPFKGKKKQDKWMRIRSAVALSEAGVVLKNIQRPDRIDANKSIFEVTFKNGVLEIPHLMIQETTEATFRNLISYEQCLPKCEHIVTSYVILMDNLIDTSEDLEKLCDEKVIENWLDPQEATQMFNNLYNDASVNEFYYIDLTTEVERYCKLCFPKWRAAYVHNYFSKPWAILSQVVGVIVLVLTILQTVFTIYSPSPSK